MLRLFQTPLVSQWQWTLKKLKSKGIITKPFSTCYFHTSNWEQMAKISVSNSFQDFPPGLPKIRLFLFCVFWAASYWRQNRLPNTCLFYWKFKKKKQDDISARRVLKKKEFWNNRLGLHIFSNFRSYRPLCKVSLRVWKFSYRLAVRIRVNWVLSLSWAQAELWQRPG